MVEMEAYGASFYQIDTQNYSLFKSRLGRVAGRTEGKDKR